MTTFYRRIIWINRLFYGFFILEYLQIFDRFFILNIEYRRPHLQLHLRADKRVSVLLKFEETKIVILSSSCTRATIGEAPCRCIWKTQVLLPSAYRDSASENQPWTPVLKRLAPDAGTASENRDCWELGLVETPPGKGIVLNELCAGRINISHLQIETHVSRSPSNHSRSSVSMRDWSNSKFRSTTCRGGAAEIFRARRPPPATASSGGGDRIFAAIGWIGVNIFEYSTPFIRSQLYL